MLKYFISKKKKNRKEKAREIGNKKSKKEIQIHTRNKCMKVGKIEIMKQRTSF